MGDSPALLEHPFGILISATLRAERQDPLSESRTKEEFPIHMLVRIAFVFHVTVTKRGTFS